MPSLLLTTTINILVEKPTTSTITVTSLPVFRFLLYAGPHSGNFYMVALLSNYKQQPTFAIIEQPIVVVYNKLLQCGMDSAESKFNHVANSPRVSQSKQDACNQTKMHYHTKSGLLVK